MKTAVRTSLAFLALTLGPSLTGIVFADQTADAFAAYKRRDYAAATRLCHPLAEKGDKWCQSMLAKTYYLGIGAPQNYPEAMKWYRKAAEKGDAAAQNSLGGMYAEGKGTPQNHAEAVKWYQRAAEQGHPGAQGTLGGLYSTGQGVARDYLQAHKWYNLAAANETDDRQREAFMKSRDLVATKMTPAQIAEARKLAREWKPKDEAGGS